MNTLRISLLVLLLTSAAPLLPGQSAIPNCDGVPPLGMASLEKIEVAERNYSRGLASDNEGLVESSLCYALQLRLAYPDRSFPLLETAVDRLVAKGSSVKIRYKAFLASTIFASPRLIDRGRLPSRDADALFVEVARQLDSKLLVSM